MKIFAPNDDDFFKPRPQLSRAAKAIRTVALCAMVLVAFLSTVGCVNIFRRTVLSLQTAGAVNQSGSLLMIYLNEIWAGLLMESLILVFLWRVYCLKRWACAFCYVCVWILWLQQLHDRAQDVGGEFWMMTALSFFLLGSAFLIRAEWRNLKKGF